MNLDILPESVHFFYLLEFLDYQTQVEYTSCCKRFYYPHMRNHARRITIDTQSYHLSWFTWKIDEAKERLWRCISEPGKQLHLKSLPFDVVSVMQKVADLTQKPSADSPGPGLSYRSLFCKYEALNWIFTSKIPLVVRDLQLYDLPESIIWDQLTAHSALMQLQRLSINIPSFSTNIPFLSSVKSLTLVNGDNLIEIAKDYCTHLQELRFFSCSGLRSVHEYDSIPSLSIIRCNHLLDISPLQNNRKIHIEHCASILDYSQSFAKTETIELEISTPQIKLDLHFWKNIHSLSLKINRPEIEIVGLLTLPKTLKRCYLEDCISNLLDFSYRPPLLQEISIFSNTSITSLKHLSALDVPIVTLDNLQKLSSLAGLGKNVQCLTLVENHRLTDYSAIASVSRSLNLIMQSPKGEHTIRAKEVTLSFRGSYPTTAFEALAQSSEVVNLRGFMNNLPFAQIQEIPVIKLNASTGLNALKTYLRKGGQVNHQKIEIYGSDFNQLEETTSPLYQQYLSKDYSISFRNWKSSPCCILLRNN